MRIVKVFIGSNHKPENEIQHILYPFFRSDDVPSHVIHVREDHSLVVFITSDASLQLLENVPESIDGIDNVKSEELTPQMVQNELWSDDKLGWLIDSIMSDSDYDNSDSSDQSEDVLYDDDDDDDDDDDEKSE